jgi:hypothetical protein
MNKVRVIEFYPKPRQTSMEWLRIKHAKAKVVLMSITEDEAEQTDAWGSVWWRILQEEGVNMKFLVIPNGKFLPAPASHYLP